jgi:hypothetical protein
MLDVFFLSYNEPYADANYKRLLEIVPLARRVNGVKGFAAAHQECARRSFTNNFYVVDSDAQILPEFDFTFTPSKHIQFWGKPENECICIWQSQNPINDLIYGHGGVKIIPKLPLLGEDKDVIDFTTGFGLNTRVFDSVSNITAFNYDEFSTWRSAFRECAKLSTNLTNEKFLNDGLDSATIEQILKETEQRLEIWTTIGRDRQFGKYCIHGAVQGRAYGIEHKDNFAALKLINDYDWMKNEFNRFFG